MNRQLRNNGTRRWLAALTVVVLAACGESPPGDGSESATLILQGGNVITMDAANPHAEAVAIADDRIDPSGRSDRTSGSD